MSVFTVIALPAFTLPLASYLLVVRRLSRQGLDLVIPCRYVRVDVTDKVAPHVPRPTRRTDGRAPAPRDRRRRDEDRSRSGRALHPPLVHGRPRPTEELLDQLIGARGRIRGRDGLRRFLDHRLQPNRG